jgi:hypothetical protein
MNKLLRLAAMLAIFFGTTAIITAGPLPDTAKIIPPETVALLNIQDVNSLQLQFQKTNLCKLYKDPAMAAFFKAFNSKWQKAMSESQDEFSKMIADVNALPSGRLAVAILLNEQSKKSGEPALLVLSQWNNINNVKTAIDKAVKKTVENGAKQEKETVRGRQIITVTQPQKAAEKPASSKMNSNDSRMRPTPKNFASLPDEQSDLNEGLSKNYEDRSQNNNAETENTNTISYCFSGETLLVSEDKEILKFIIARIDGSAGQSLADSENYQSTMKAVGPVHDIDLYVSIEQIIKFFASQEGGQMNSQIAAYGLDNVAGVGISCGVGRVSGTPVIVKGLIKINGAKKGIMKIIEPQNASLRLPRFIDTSAVSLSIYNISLKNAYDEFVKMMSTITPGFAAMINQPLVPGDETGKGKVELKKDILDYLGPQLIVASSIKKPFVASSDSAKMVTAIAVSDKTALEKSLAAVHSVLLAPGKPEYKREVLGQTIYLSDAGALPFLAPRRGARPMADVAQKSEPEPESAKFAFTITNTYLILGSEENVMQTVRLLNNKDSGSIMNVPWFVRAKSALVGAFGAAGLSDGRTYGEYLWWNLKETGKRKAGASLFDPTQMALSGLGGYFDFSLLPDFEKVKKYFGVSANYLTARPDGYYFEFQQLDLKSE